MVEPIFHGNFGDLGVNRLSAAELLPDLVETAGHHVLRRRYAQLAFEAPLQRSNTRQITSCFSGFTANGVGDRNEADQRQE